MKPKQKVKTVMHEFKKGTLHSGSGGAVKDRKQAIAIALHEAGISKDQKKSTKGSPEFTDIEVRQGYRKI